MKKFLTLAFIFIIVIIGCEKAPKTDKQNDSFDFSKIDVGYQHNQICKNVFYHMPESKSQNLTIQELDSIFLLLYPETTQTDLNFIKSILAETQNFNLAALYDKKITSQNQIEKQYYSKIDSVLNLYEKTNLEETIFCLEQISINSISDTQLTNIKKYGIASTIDLTKSSIILWTGFSTQSKFLSPTDAYRAYQADCFVYTEYYYEYTEDWNDAMFGQSLPAPAEQRRCSLAAYASLYDYIRHYYD